jgi:hypothetical protein
MADKKESGEPTPGKPVDEQEVVELPALAAASLEKMLEAAEGEVAKLRSIADVSKAELAYVRHLYDLDTAQHSAIEDGWATANAALTAQLDVQRKAVHAEADVKADAFAQQWQARRENKALRERLDYGGRLLNMAYAQKTDCECILAEHIVCPKCKLRWTLTQVPESGIRYHEGDDK